MDERAEGGVERGGDLDSKGGRKGDTFNRSSQVQMYTFCNPILLLHLLRCFKGAAVKLELALRYAFPHPITASDSSG